MYRKAKVSGKSAGRLPAILGSYRDEFGTVIKRKFQEL